METISEEWLRLAARPPSEHEDSKRERTEAEIRSAVSTGLRGHPYRVYVKGSYANTTNVRLNFDVDIAVEYTGTYFYDRHFDAEGLSPESLGIVPAGPTMSQEEWRELVHSCLTAHFGNSAVTAGRIASRIRERTTTLPADVVPCWSYRRYDSSSRWHEGTRIRPRQGPDVINFPAQHLENGIAKNDATGRRYKRMVRILKRLQDHLVVHAGFPSPLPSYLVECAVYNVPNPEFGRTTYRDDLRAVLATLWNDSRLGAEGADYEQVNRLLWLFRGPNHFDMQDVHRLADAAWNYLEFN